MFHRLLPLLPARGAAAPEPEPPDTTPDAFAFTDVTDATVSTVYESNTITLAGLTAAAAVTVTGGEYSKNAGAYTSTAGTVINGDTVKVRHTSSGSASTATNTVLTIGGVSDTYTTTTAAAGDGFSTTPVPLDLAFSASNGSVTTDIADSSSGTTAKRFTQNTNESTHYLYPNAPASQQVIRLDVEMKAVGSGAYGWITFDGSNIAYFNISTGTLGTIPGSLTASIVATANGFYRCRVEGTANATGILVGSAMANDTFYFTGDGASGFDWCNAQYFPAE